MKNRYEIANKVSIISIIVNVVLTLFKLSAGILSNSAAMAADAIHSASDILTTVAVMISFKIAQKPEDADHPYGHERAESIAAKIVAICLFGAGVGIGWQAIVNLGKEGIPVPGRLALYAAIVSIVVKELLFWYTIIIAKKINSTALQADAWHHRSDAISSIATFIGIGVARIGFPMGDAIAALIVSIIIIKVSYDIFIKSIKELMDSSASDEMLSNIHKNILSVQGVEGIDSLKTRIHGNVIYADVEIVVDNSISIDKGHSIARVVEDTVTTNVENVKAVMVHIHPCSCPHNALI